jgi:hypothetical protein
MDTCVAEAVCLIMAHVCTRGDFASRYCAADGCRALVQLVRTHVRSDAVKSYGTSAMHSLAAHAEEHKDKFRKANVLPLLRVIKTQSKGTQAEETARDLLKLLQKPFDCQRLCTVS